MNITAAVYLKSAPGLSDAPVMDNKNEFAFIGRSNVGKSSVINYLANKKQLALTSNSPGKTVYLNYFIINNIMYWVDLPGYGYAVKSKKDRKSWNKNMYEYLEKRENLTCSFLLIDSSISPQKIDIDMVKWLYEHKVYFAIIFTKIDKANKKIIEENIQNFFLQLPFPTNTEITYFKTSATKRYGREEILKAIQESIV